MKPRLNAPPGSSFQRSFSMASKNLVLMRVAAEISLRETPRISRSRLRCSPKGVEDIPWGPAKNIDAGGISVNEARKRDPSTASGAARKPRGGKKRGTPLRMTAGNAARPNHLWGRSAGAEFLFQERSFDCFRRRAQTARREKARDFAQDDAGRGCQSASDRQWAENCVCFTST